MPKLFIKFRNSTLSHMSIFFQQQNNNNAIVDVYATCGLPSLNSTGDLTFCEKYNETMCKNSSNGEGCNSTEECKPAENEKGNCYVLWQNNSKSFTIKLKGCWVPSHDGCSSGNRCVETRREPNVQLLFCCCEGSMCNQKMTISTSLFTPTAVTKTSTVAPVSRASNSHDEVIHILVYTLLPILVIASFISVGYLWYRKHKMRVFNELPTTDPSPLPPPSPLLGLRPIQLIEVKAQGRFGAVWKAMLNNEPVAVKIFPPQDKNSWQEEQSMYKQPQMSHENILHYIGVERHGEHMQVEYWLITAYHDKGSLCDYLKANLVSWGEVLSIADSISKGLMHLHEEIPGHKGGKYKPAMAHRDFKSKNVLIKNDMSACIADFGLALVFEQGKPIGEAHGQVGTRRYMAPEVLEGAINFNRDAFLRIDMYACGLVLWELLSRCSAQEGPVDQYMLPFEDTVGQHPTLEDMQEAVCQKKLRPKFKDYWRKHPGISSLCDTIEECFDQDAEARLSASCVQERISFLYKTQPPYPRTQMSMVKEISCSTATSNICPDIEPVSRSPPILPPKESSI
ncbi:activin receptor type-2B isoform X1 [Parasteatoda tepidariorum]|uniref:activin receptor type-2B isoform X1 n=1 Tax=Parasteatoda tepidariorum TaxID=114398 RepID=UPI001C717C44|nr:activin receptor type-2B isoform X2 [Parasteatoda tepidariorum]